MHEMLTTIAADNFLRTQRRVIKLDINMNVVSRRGLQKKRESSPEK